MAYRTAEIIAIGDEMTSGARLDTNTQWLSRRLGELGLEVQFHSTVGDTLSHIADTFRVASGRADVLVATGGLGPTQDDLTRQAIAETLGAEMKLDAFSLSHIESIFVKRNRDMPRSNEIQAMFPVGSQPIFNPQGTAPGIDAMVPRAGRTPARIFALPGVPAEMKTMFNDSVVPAILGGESSQRHIRYDVMKFFGVGESEMEHRLGDMIARDHVPRVGITVTAATISLRIAAMADSPDACQAMIASTRREILERVGDLHFGDGEHFEQEHAIDSQLRQRGERLMVIELGRAAPLGDWFAAIGDSPAFAGGLSLGNLPDLYRLTGIENPGQDLEASLKQLKQRTESHWGLMVDGYPSLETLPDAPLPAADVDILISDPDGKLTQRRTKLGGHPSILHRRIAKAALAMLRETISSRVPLKSV